MKAVSRNIGSIPGNMCSGMENRISRVGSLCVGSGAKAMMSAEYRCKNQISSNGKFIRGLS
jgi:hypothetical protein